MSTVPLRVVVQPLTVEGFGAFGAVVEHGGGGRRRYLEAPFEADPHAPRPAFWVSRLGRAAQLPLPVTQLERHPFTAQTFLPLSQVRYLVVVAPSQPDGAPDLAGLRAFIAGPGQGVVYRLGCWHHGLTVLDAPAEFAVMMATSGQGDDDEFRDLPGAVEIHPAESARHG